MAAKTPEQRQVSVTDFKAHCTEYLRAVEKGDVEFIITRHGKVVAITSLPKPEESSEPQSVAEWIGSGRGTMTFAPDYDPHAAAFDDDEWEMNKD